jgi:two-component system, sensor histidine kinase and response regulator
MNESGKILVVDDESPLRMNLRAFLEDIGFEVLEASNGPQAIEVCHRQSPHVILLDITMPDMDGFEVCRRLKADPITAEPPVIFISALMNTEDKVKAFACGGVDYVTKPFHFEEVESRVRAHLEIHRQRRQLQEQHEALLRLERLRDNLTHMIAHDMRNPLGGILGYLQLALAELSPEDANVAVLLRKALTGTEHLSGMITQMLDMSRLESGTMPLNRCMWDITALVRKVAESQEALKGKRQIRISGQSPMLAWCDPGIVERVIGNLVGNARKFTKEGGSIEIRTESLGKLVRIAVVDDGPGVPLAFQKSIFEKFGQVPGEAQEKGFGLGLTFCRLAIEAHQGEIGVESEPGKGSTFWFTLPMEE